MIREFKLSPRGQGVSCNEEGPFVGSLPLLRRGGNRWEPRECGQLSKRLSSHFGLPVDLSSKAGGLKAIANALNEGDLARAQIATLLLAIPDPPLSKSIRSNVEAIQFIRDLHWSGLIGWDEEIENVLTKAGYNPDEPRDERGRWTQGGSADIQLADASMSDAVNDPVAEAAARAAERHAAGSLPSQTKPGDSERGDFWQTLGARLSHDVQSALSQIGQAELTESDANLAVSTAAANTIIGGLKAYANYRAQPWIGSDGVPIQVPVINTGDPLSDQAALIGHELFAPNEPLTRPAANADWIDPIVDLASGGAMAAGPTLRVVGEGATAAADSVELAADTEFTIPLPELPENFDITLPIGKVEMPENLVPGTKDFGNYVHDRIGNLFQGMVTNTKLTLNMGPGANGPDIIVPDDAISRLGFKYAEIKPLSTSSISRFNNQVLNVWDLEGQVQAITYDRDGNINYGFPGPWQ